jgi:hypothetical protein
MPGLVPGIHVFFRELPQKTWMAGINPAMTTTAPERYALQQTGRLGASANVVCLQDQIWSICTPF